MNQYNLSNEEDMQLRVSIMLRNRKTLYEYFCDLPLEDLKVYPKKGCQWWMGRAARSPKALMLRDYVLHWRLAALDFRQKYSRKYLETPPLQFLSNCIQKSPLRRVAILLLAISP